MASQGPNSPATITNEVLSGSAWSNPSNAATENGVTASTGNIDGGSDWLQAVNLGFSIPGTATIDGVLVEAKVQGDAAGVVFQSVELVSGGATLGTNFNGTVWPSSLTYLSIGGVADLWSAVITPAIANGTTFGFRMTAIDNLAGGSPAAVDHIRMTVYFTDAGGGAGSASVVVHLLTGLL